MDVLVNSSCIEPPAVLDAFIRGYSYKLRRVQPVVMIQWHYKSMKCYAFQYGQNYYTKANRRLRGEKNVITP